MKQLFFLIFSIVTVASNGQSDSRQHLYYAMVVRFYDYLEKDSVTIQEAIDLFGNYALEVEEFLFFENCNCNNCGSEFSKRLLSPNLYISSFFKEIRSIKNLFSPLSKTIAGIDTVCFNIYDEGLPSTISVDCSLGRGRIVYFNLNKYSDETVYITNIFLPNGESFYNEILKNADGIAKSYLFRFAIINDPDGFTNVRKDKGGIFPIVGIINSNEIFKYTPNNESNWWRISSNKGSISGYMHNSRILPIGTLPEEKKKELLQIE